MAKSKQSQVRNVRGLKCCRQLLPGPKRQESRLHCSHRALARAITQVCAT